MAKSLKFGDVVRHVTEHKSYPDGISAEDIDHYTFVAEAVARGAELPKGAEGMTLAKLGTMLAVKPEPKPEPVEPTEEQEPVNVDEPTEEQEPEVGLTEPREVVHGGVRALLKPRGVSGVDNLPVNLPAFNKPSVDRGTPVTQNRNRRNELGLVRDPATDTCHHLNASWKGGVCMVKGNRACPFLEGRQKECDQFIDRADAPKRQRRNLR